MHFNSTNQFISVVSISSRTFKVTNSTKDKDQVNFFVFPINKNALLQITNFIRNLRTNWRTCWWNWVLVKHFLVQPFDSKPLSSTINVRNYISVSHRVSTRCSPINITTSLDELWIRYSFFDIPIRFHIPISKRCVGLFLIGKWNLIGISKKEYLI